jgi:hypothetical protein
VSLVQVYRCTTGYFVSGINIGFMPSQGSGSDDEAASGFAIRCKAWATNLAAASYDITMQPPSSGSSWLGWRECSSPQGFVNSAQVRIEADQGAFSDDTGLLSFYFCFYGV